MKSKEERAKEIQSEIRDVLLNDWDPIGIRKEAGLYKEYDAYIGRVYRLLASKASEDDIISLLYKIEIEEIGINSNKEKLRLIARKLLKLNVSLNK